MILDNQRRSADNREKLE
jgi:hypothetical protein